MNIYDKSFIDATAHLGKTLLISYDEAEVVVIQLVTDYENDVSVQRDPKQEFMTPLQLVEIYLANTVSVDDKNYREKVKREVDSLSSTNVTPADNSKNNGKGGKK